MSHLESGLWVILIKYTEFINDSENNNSLCDEMLPMETKSGPNALLWLQLNKKEIQLQTLNQHLSEICFVILLKTTLIPNLCWRKRLQIDSKRPCLYPFEKGTIITVELYNFVWFYFILLYNSIDVALWYYNSVDWEKEMWGQEDTVRT